MISKRYSFITIIILISAFFVQTFYIDINGISIKFRYFAYVIFLISLLRNLKIKKNNIDIFVIIMYIYLIINTAIIDNKIESLLSIIYLTLIILVPRIVFSNIKLLQENNENIYKSIYILNAIGIIAYTFIFVFIGLDKVLQIRYLASDNHKLLENSIYSFMMYDGSLPRYNGYILDPNFAGLYSIFMIYVVILLDSIEKEKVRYYNRALITSIISLILTLSRGNFLVIIVVILIYQTLIKLKTKKNMPLINKKSKRFIGYMLVLALCLSIALMRKTEGIDFDFIKSRYSFSDAESSRFDVWKTYMENLEQPKEVLFGNGLNRNLRLTVNGLDKTSHNTYIYIYYNLGIIGLVVFMLIPLSLLIILAKQYSISKSNYKTYAIAISFSIGILIEAFTIDTFMSTLIWGTLILGYSVCEIKE